MSLLAAANAAMIVENCSQRFEPSPAQAVEELRATDFSDGYQVKCADDQVVAIYSGDTRIELLQFNGLTGTWFTDNNSSVTPDQLVVTVGNIIDQDQLLASVPFSDSPGQN